MASSAPLPAAFATKDCTSFARSGCGEAANEKAESEYSLVTAEVTYPIVSFARAAALDRYVEN